MSKKIVKYIVLAAAGLAVAVNFAGAVGVLKTVLSAFKTLLIGVFFALALKGAVDFFQKKIYKNKKYAGTFAIITVYVLFAGVVAGIAFVLVPPLVESVKSVGKNLPSYVETAKKFVMDLLQKNGVSEEKAASLLDGLLKKGGEFLSGFMENISAVAERIIRFISSAVDVFFSIVISVYILSERKMLGNSLKRFIRSILPVKVSDWLLRFCSVFGKVFSRFMTGQALEAFVLGGMCFLGMLVFKLPYAPVVSVVIGFSNLIPILGAYVGTTFGFLLILMVSPKKAFIFVAFEILLQQVENNLTYPKVVGKTLELSGFWTITAVLVGGALFGFWGVMLAAPTMAVIYKMIEYRLGQNPNPEALMPKLSEPTKETGADGAQKTAK